LSSGGSLTSYTPGATVSYPSGGVAYQAVAAPAVYPAPVAVAAPVVAPAPAVLTQTVPAPAIYAPAAPVLASLISTAPVQATPIEAKAVLTPVIKKYHKDHVSTVYSSRRFVICLRHYVCRENLFHTRIIRKACNHNRFC
jgi:hypothetical protein